VSGPGEGTPVSSLATCHLSLATEENEPLRITIYAGARPAAASRDAAPGNELSATRRSCSPAVLLDPRGGPIGVVKLLRARGGCLGVIRIRAWKAAKCPGELPNERRSRNARATQGTETSQYLEEKKSTETPSVAASERGPAQTGRDTVRGRGAGVVEWTASSRSPLENGTRAGDSPVGVDASLLSGTQVGSGT
jgi:hypothetical protein